MHLRVARRAQIHLPLTVILEVIHAIAICLFGVSQLHCKRLHSPARKMQRELHKSDLETKMQEASVCLTCDCITPHESQIVARMENLQLHRAATV